MGNDRSEYQANLELEVLTNVRKRDKERRKPIDPNFDETWIRKQINKRLFIITMVGTISALAIYFIDKALL